jgi:hypothetical protein
VAFTRAGLLNSFRAYYDNATAKRDFRAQLRGNKALWLWSVYLALLFAVAYFVYDGIQRNGAVMSVSEVQDQLQQFYQTMMIWMAVIVCVITPALTAGTIPVERQRRSLDLLFSAPVSMKGLLVGKMISSYRYLWMLLVLSLPITSLCVVMGGASWSDVLSAYAILSFSGIVMTALGLLISSMAAAILWTYLSVIGYLVVAGMFAGSGTAMSMMRDPTVMPWYVGMFPFTAGLVGPSHCVFLGQNIPNWIPAGIIAFLISKLCLLGAGSALSFHRAPETKKLRVYGLIYLFALSVGGCWALNNVSVGLGGAQFTAGFIGVVTVLLFFLMPYMYSYGTDMGQKYRNDGRFSFRNAFWSNPSGSLPYTILLWAALAGGALIGQAIAGTTMSSGPMMGAFPARSATFGSSANYTMAPYCMALWSLSYFVMWWCIGRTISSRTSTLKAARTGFVGALVLIVALPAPLISLINSAMSYQYMGNGVGGAWALHILYPLFSNEGKLFSPIYAACMLLLGFGVLVLEKRKDVPPVVAAA